ncbi:hypothetical protein [Beggiatoa leptomitoformis]|uniref:Peptidase n=1 Tax=Beggiatoa leptomitoformis TaxID=288004 RepID=A0A2N9YHI3_9GAMM|nr:hypothetical protein [Beggiatoa leptomitoformis]AUI69859.1 hypothetical protein BLE401_14945 [Beggiatoa leptomitoformis]QGX03666.1 hypothetical protein AL038_18895 [Beggiatoa leptomitoformis]
MFTDTFTEIFRAGKQTDSKGDTFEWSIEDLDQIIANHGDASNSAPIVIGHPKTNDPAWGWTAELKRVGNVLLAKFRDVAPEFEALVKEGRYRNRSVSLAKTDSGWMLRHVGFLGAVPPAIKGLKPIFNASDDACIFEFNCEKEYADMPPEVKDKANGEAEAKTVKAQEDKTDPKNFNEKIIESKEFRDYVQAQIELARTEATKATEREIAALKARLASQERAAMFAENKQLLDALVGQGKLIPAQVTGLSEFMVDLREAEGSRTFEFSSTDGKQEKSSPSVFFKQFLEKLPQQVQLGRSNQFGQENDVATSVMQQAKMISDYVEAQGKAGRIISFSTAKSELSGQGKI